MITRELKLLEKLGKNSSAFLFGARGTGKTSLYKLILPQLTEPYIVIDLLDATMYTSYLSQPEMFRAHIESALKKHGKLFVVVDEIQKLPVLLDTVHLLIELYKPNLRFLLTGSSARKLKRGGANLLAGRALTFKLHPLTHNECPLSLNETLQLGSLPGMVLNNEAPESSLRSYISSYLREEIQQEALVRKIDAFSRFLDLAGQFHGEPVNASALGKAIGVSANTLLTYYEILQDTLLCFNLPGWSASLKKQLRTTPKMYLFDNGVANALKGELKVELRPSTSRYGKLFEAFIVQCVFRLNDYFELDLKFSYWKTNFDIEVGLVVSRSSLQPLMAIEIKSSVNPIHQEMKGLKQFAEEYPNCRLLCFCQTPLRFEREGIEFFPWKEGLKEIEKL